MNRRVYVDLDGVLADFVSGFCQHFGVQPGEVDRAELKRLKQTFAQRCFFATLPPFEGARTFMQQLAEMGLQPAILTAVSEFDSEVNARQKAEWVAEHIGPYPFHWCRKSHEKARFAAPGHILIDDRPKSIEPFVAAGGQGILHQDFPTSLMMLQRLIQKG